MYVLPENTLSLAALCKVVSCGRVNCEAFRKFQ